jgi:hypothetical protein
VAHARQQAFRFSNLKSGKSVDEIAHFILKKGRLAATRL